MPKNPPSPSRARDTVESLPKVFDEEALGASFEQLAIDVVRGETTDSMSRWFRAKVGEADLVIWTDNNKRIIKHQLCFYGQVVEWNPINGTRTGFVFEEEIAQEIGGDPAPDTAALRSASALKREELIGDDDPQGIDDGVSETIRFDSSAQEDVVRQAIRLLMRIPGLTEPDRSNLVYTLRESPKLHRNARERALKAWAPKAEEIIAPKRSTFWKRLTGWMFGSGDEA